MTSVETIERDNDSLCTPEWILERVRKVHPIGLDPCSNRWSKVGARVSVTKLYDADGLSVDWSTIGSGDESIWLNPPYSDPLPWCERFAKYCSDRIPGFALVKNDPSTRWSAVLRQVRTAQCDFTKRVKFEGGAHATGMFASTLFYVGPSPFLFCHVFQDVGDVRVFR